jgi:hypothetical protein
VWGLVGGGAELAVLVDAAGEQVGEQALLDALQLGNQRLGLADLGVQGVEDLGDFDAFRCSGIERTDLAKLAVRDNLRAASNAFQEVDPPR